MYRQIPPTNYSTFYILFFILILYLISKLTNKYAWFKRIMKKLLDAVARLISHPFLRQKCNLLSHSMLAVVFYNNKTATKTDRPIE